jgi:glycosyltransferase involved in cell wall biosynthesis
MGYLWSYNAKQAHPDKPKYLQQVEQIETEAIRHASHIVVTTEDIRQRIVDRQPQVADKITRIPNYVDTDVFRPMDEPKQYDLVYVGRIAKEKNLQALLQAVDRVGLTIAMIGDGDMRETLQQEFQHMGERVMWLGRIPNTELATYINRARAYVLSSFYEGHPKALIEAMACGVPVIGTNIYGIQQVIQHGENGYLCDTAADGLQSAIETVLANDAFMHTLAENARQYVVEHYALDKIAKVEYNILRQLSLN